MPQQPRAAPKAYVPPGGLSGGAVSSVGGAKTIGGAAGGGQAAQLQAQV